jgi:DNA polymerase V
MIALVDCNNFYASCERLFQPQLNNKPIVVLSNNDTRVIARSDEAKQLGIKMGDPAFVVEAMLQQHQIQVFSSNYTLYGDISDRVMATLGSFTDKLEVYSIDEAFIQLDDVDQASHIRNTIKQNIGIPVSIGIAPTKTLAKLANDLAKKRGGVYCLHNAEQVLQQTAVEDIWGIGEQHAKLLMKNNIHNGWQLIQTPEEWIRKNLSVVGQRMVNELKGIPCIDMEAAPPKKQQICVMRGFGKLLTEKDDVLEALANFTAMVAAKLRSGQLATRMIQVSLQTNAYRPHDKQYFRSINVTLPVATSQTNELLHYARKGLDAIYQPGYNYSKTGCIAMELVPDTQVQYGIFDQQNRKRDSGLMKTIDAVNRSFGANAVRFALQGFSAQWTMRQLKISPCYTTRINDIVTIKI